MVSVLPSSAIDRIKPKTTKLIFVASPPSTQNKRERAVWLAQNQANVSVRGDMAYRELLFQ
jgi:hypothetical protein